MQQNKIHPVAVDFETEKIQPRPHYPPKPVGVAIKYFGEGAKYYAWGHACENNCTKEEAEQALALAFAHDGGVVCHNAKFDIDVAEVHMGVAPPQPHQVHDTMILLFLDDPHQSQLGLKPASERLLDMPPEEQDAVGAWLLKNQPVEGVKIGNSKNSQNYFGAYLNYAPAGLVGEYAKGDVERTEALFNLLHKRIVDEGMLEAYKREQELMPILLEMERQGIPVDVAALTSDIEKYSAILTEVEVWLYDYLRVPASAFNLDSADELVDAMIRVDKVDTSKLPKTPKGKLQTNKDALLLGVSDKILLDCLTYRSQLSTCLNTFMKPWHLTTEASGGVIYTTWNQTKVIKGSSSVGTRTGRLSSTPNFQNIPKKFDEAGKSLFTQQYGMPNVRSYLKPFDGHCFIDRDYSQQEPRILAHFEDGALQETYNKNPWVDLHDHAKAELAKMGLMYERKAVKNTNLGLIYGMGVAKLAEKNDMGQDEAKALKNSVLALYPGLKAMYSDMRRMAKTDTPIRTWGGRVYYCEPPEIMDDGRVWEKDYKMVNVLIQGSAADCTKDALIRYHKVKHKDAKIVLNVHDQITVSAPTHLMVSEMEVLRQAMESVEFDVPILSEGSVSYTNWAELMDYDKKGVILNIS